MIGEYPAVRRGLRVNSYAAALFANEFKRNKAFKAVRHLNIHATLRKDEYEDLDRVVVGTGKEVLVGVQDLRNTAGLLRPVSIATAIAQYNRMSTMPASTLAMSPLMAGQRGRVDFTLTGVPIPFIFNDFQIDIRTLTASRRDGDGLDVSQGAESAYQVSLAMETLLFNGTPAIAVADRTGTLNTIAGYTTFANRNTGTAPGDWDDATSGYANIFNTIEEMKRVLREDFFGGPYWVYVNSANWADLGLTNINTDRRPMDTLRADPEIAAVRYSARLAAGAVVMVDPKPRTVEWVEGASMRVVEWDEMGGLGTNFRIITAGAPLIKSTSENQCGVAHFTGAGT